MFLENQVYSTMDELIKNKFQNAVHEQNEIISFTNPKEEFDALRNGVGIRTAIGSVIIQITGKDVLDFLHRISTNKISDMKLFDTRNTLFLNEKGRFIDRTTLISLENEHLLVGNRDEDGKLLSWINKYIIMEDISASDFSERYTLLELIGKQTESFLSMLIGNEINSVSTNTVKKFYIDGFMFYLFLNIENNDVKIHKILIEKERTADFIEYLFNNKSVFDLLLIGKSAYDAFRIKNKIPAFPNEINDGTNPYETDLIKDVCFTKGCYIGQEVIARLDTYDKVKRKMILVSAEEHLDFAQSITITGDSTSDAGLLTSFSNSELLDEKIGLALINKKVLEAKEELYVNNGNKRIALKIAG
jgi:folate-binding protein YgfZ